MNTTDNSGDAELVDRIIADVIASYLAHQLSEKVTTEEDIKLIISEAKASLQQWKQRAVVEARIREATYIARYYSMDVLAVEKLHERIQQLTAQPDTKGQGE